MCVQVADVRVLEHIVLGGLGLVRQPVAELQHVFLAGYHNQGRPGDVVDPRFTSFRANSLAVDTCVNVLSAYGQICLGDFHRPDVMGFIAIDAGPDKLFRLRDDISACTFLAGRERGK